MKVEMQRKGRYNKDRVLTLMKECASNRREWIKESEPAVSEILESFPALKDHTMVSIMSGGL